MKKEKALLLVGASGGIGTALLDYLSVRTEIICIPTYYRNRPIDSPYDWVQLNTIDFNSSKNIFETITKKYEIDLVIDVTGCYFASKLQNTSSQTINEVISTNLVAPLNLAKNAQAFMSIGAKIIHMSSILSTSNVVGSSVYAASKAGLERGILSLSTEFAASGHAICGIRLGYMNYGMTHRIDKKIRARILKNLPEEKFIDIKILGDLVIQIMNSDAEKVNGNIYDGT